MGDSAFLFPPNLKRMEMTKKIFQKTIIIAITLAFILSPLSYLFAADDYPAGYLGPGHREYLSGKIQNGYYVEVFVNRDIRQKERAVKRNDIEKIVSASYEAAPQSATGILAAEFQKKNNTDNLKIEISKQRQQREQVASAQIEGGFTYVPHSDGKIEYFKDGLLIRVENERIVDQYGNVAIKNTSNIKYNDKRLMTNYEATVRDHLGNLTRLAWYGGAYTADSLYYGGANTEANKNLSEYYLEEIDPAGNVRLTHFSGASYSGKSLKAFNQTTQDSIYGNAEFRRFNITGTSYEEEGTGTDSLTYRLSRDKITNNNKEQATGYTEVKEVTQLNGGIIKTVTEVKNTYLAVPHQFGPDVEEADQDRLLESVITTSVENPDGSKRREVNTVTNQYNGLNLTGAQGASEFSGQEAGWLDGAEYRDGAKYNGTSQIQYELSYGEPKLKQSDTTASYYSPSGDDLLRSERTTVTSSNGLVNNLPRLLDTKELSNTTYYPLVDPNGVLQTGIKHITTTYTYEPSGNLSKAAGKGSGSGYEFMNNNGWMNYASDIDIDYEVILGEAKQKKSQENKDYKPE